jgi:hypothetical protein
MITEILIDKGEQENIPGQRTSMGKGIVAEECSDDRQLKAKYQAAEVKDGY